MASRYNRGVTLIELIVALLILEFAGLIAVTAALQVGRTQARLVGGAEFDLARVDSMVAQQMDSVCRAASAPLAMPVRLAAGHGRPPLVTAARCGQ